MPIDLQREVRVAVVARATAAVVGGWIGVLPEFDEGIRRLQHRHAGGDFGQSDGAVGHRVVAIEVGFLHDLEPEQIAVEGEAFVEIGHADGDVMYADDHDVTRTIFGSPCSGVDRQRQILR